MTSKETIYMSKGLCLVGPCEFYAVPLLPSILRDLVDTLPQGILRTAADGRFKRCDQHHGKYECRAKVH